MSDFIDFSEVIAGANDALAVFSAEIESGVDILLGERAWYIHCSDAVMKQQIRASVMDLVQNMAMGAMSEEAYRSHIAALNEQAEMM